MFTQTSVSVSPVDGFGKRVLHARPQGFGRSSVRNFLHRLQSVHTDRPEPYAPHPHPRYADTHAISLRALISPARNCEYRYPRIPLVVVTGEGVEGRRSNLDRSIEPCHRTGSDQSQDNLDRGWQVVKYGDRGIARWLGFCGTHKLKLGSCRVQPGGRGVGNSRDFDRKMGFQLEAEPPIPFL